MGRSSSTSGTAAKAGTSSKAGTSTKARTGSGKRGARTVRGVDGFDDAADETPGRSSAPDLEVNLGVVCGPCSSTPEVRALESGSRLATFALRCPTGQAGKATSVPVTVWDPPAWIETVAPGDVLVVVGRMRRRFYQRPGGLGSRVDLEAELVGRARDRRRIDAALRRVEVSLDVLR